MMAGRLYPFEGRARARRRAVSGCGSRRRRPPSRWSCISCSSSPGCWRWCSPAGSTRASRGFYGEVSVMSPANVPVFQFKTIIPIAGGLLVLQGLAQVCRCIVCLRTGEWPAHLEDVEEMEIMLQRQHADEAGPSGRGGGDRHRRRAMSDPVVAVVMLGIFVLTILLGFPICFTLMAMGVALRLLCVLRRGADAQHLRQPDFRSAGQPDLFGDGQRRAHRRCPCSCSWATSSSARTS